MGMFQRGGETHEEAETVIGASVKVEGNFVGSGNVIIEGVVNGSLKTTKDLRVGEAAKVKADVDAANISVAGEIQGNVRASGRLELVASAKIMGNVEAPKLVVAEGAILNGKCTMVKPETGVAPVPSGEKKRAA